MFLYFADFELVNIPIYHEFKSFRIVQENYSDAECSITIIIIGVVVTAIIGVVVR